MGKGRKTRTGKARRRNQTFIGAWVPQQVAAAVDQAIGSLNVDRSTFMRQALEEKLRKPPDEPPDTS